MTAKLVALSLPRLLAPEGFKFGLLEDSVSGGVGISIRFVLGLLDASSDAGRISRGVVELIVLSLLGSWLDVVVETLVPTLRSLFW